MTILDKILKKDGKEKKPEVQEQQISETEQKKEGRSLGESVLKRPWVSEKARDLSSENTFVFMVDTKANKHMVRDEVERKYDVSVTSVRIVRGHKRAKRFAGRTGSKHSFKKAMVTLKPGQKIDVFPV